MLVTVIDLKNKRWNAEILDELAAPPEVLFFGARAFVIAEHHPGAPTYSERPSQRIYHLHPAPAP